jgi:hypothetical protein
LVLSQGADILDDPTLLRELVQHKVMSAARDLPVWLGLYIKSVGIWDVMRCSLIKVCRIFRGIHCLQIRMGRAIKQRAGRLNCVPPKVSKRSPVYMILIFFLNLCGGTLGTAATTGLLYRPQMIGDVDCGEIGGMKIGRGNQSTRKKTCPSATLPTTNPTWLDPGLNPGCRGGKPATNRLSYGAALHDITSQKTKLFTIASNLPGLYVFHSGLIQMLKSV